jgi:DNA-binding NarL/FixJ family response regulator
MRKVYEHAVLERDGCRKLSDKELEILKLCAKGLNHKEVAAKLGISERTVSTHNYNSFRKIKARNIVEAINHVNKFYKG